MKIAIKISIARVLMLSSLARAGKKKTVKNDKITSTAVMSMDTFMLCASGFNATMFLWSWRILRVL